MISDVEKEIYNLNMESQLDNTIAVWERNIIGALTLQAQVALRRLARIEVSLRERKGSNPGTGMIRKDFQKIIVDLQAIPASFATLPEGMPSEYGFVSRLNEIWGVTLAAFSESIRLYKEELGVKDWGLAGSGGFPFGIGSAFSVTFE